MPASVKKNTSTAQVKATQHVIMAYSPLFAVGKGKCRMSAKGSGDKECQSCSGWWSELGKTAYLR